MVSSKLKLKSSDVKLVSSKSPQDREQAYIELQKKLGAPRDEVQTTDLKTAEEEALRRRRGRRFDEVHREAHQSSTHWNFRTCVVVLGLQRHAKGAGQNLNETEIPMFDNVVGKGDPKLC